MSVIYPDPPNQGDVDGIEVFPPEYVAPDSATSGNIPEATPPPPLEQFYAYELDIADTDLVWSAGQALDTAMVRQYIVDRGYEAAGVDAQTDASGLPTGLLTVRSNAVGVQIYPDVLVSIEDATESNTTAIVTAATKIASTAIDTLPADATFSGTLRFAANVWRELAEGDMGIVPVVEGADGSFVSVGGSLTPTPVYVDIDVSALAGGTAPTFGLKYRGDGAGIAATNIVVNPAPQTTWYNSQTGVSVSNVAVADPAPPSGRAMVLTALSTGISSLTAPFDNLVFASTTAMTCSAYLWSPTPSQWAITWFRFFVRYTDASADSSPVVVETVGTTPTRIIKTLTPNPAKTVLNWGFYIYATPNTIGAELRIAAAQLENIPDATSYVDGSLGDGYAWTGTANNSSSTRAALTYISDAVISGTLVDGVETPAAEIDPLEWATYNGTRYTGLLETIVAWTSTAEGLITPKPDLSRIVNFQQYLEQNDYEVAQITGNWNFATPDEAPVSPELHVYARGAVDPLISDAFLYSEIPQSDLDAFSVNWNATITLSTLTRKVAGLVATPGQQDRSSPIFHFTPDTSTLPSIDVRDGDYWQLNATPFTIFERVHGEWVEPTGTVDVNATNQTSTGRKAIANAYGATATGVESEASGSVSVAEGFRAKATASGAIAIGSESEAFGINSLARGYAAKVPSTSPRSIAEGAGAVVPASTPDTKYLKVNKLKIVPSDGTGATTIELQSPDGASHVLAISNAGVLSVDGVPV